MPDAPAHSELPTPVDERPIDFDQPCRVCGYNLRTLLPSAVCPECGAPVIDSLPANVLGDCDPDWLSSVGRGIERIRDALLIYLMMPFIVAGLLVAAEASAGAALIAAAFLGAPIALKLTGLWRLTRPEPKGRLRQIWDRPASHAWIAHCADAACLALVAMIFISRPPRLLSPAVALTFYSCTRFHTTWATARFARALREMTGAAILPWLLSALTWAHYLMSASMLAIAIWLSMPAVAARLQMMRPFFPFWVLLPPVLTALLVVIVVLMIGLAAMTMPVLQRIRMVIVAAEARARRIRAGCNSAVAERIASQIETLD